MSFETRFILAMSALALGLGAVIIKMAYLFWMLDFVTQVR